MPRIPRTLSHTSCQPTPRGVLQRKPVRPTAESTGGRLQGEAGVLSAEEPQLACLAAGVGTRRCTETGAGRAFLGAVLGKMDTRLHGAGSWPPSLVWASLVQAAGDLKGRTWQRNMTQARTIEFFFFFFCIGFEPEFWPCMGASLSNTEWS